MEKDSTIFMELLTVLCNNTKIQNSLRVPVQSLKVIFQSLDRTNKGYLDLVDIYELASEVTEDQLFIIFKHLDRGRNGRVQIQDLASAMGKDDHQGYTYAKDNFGESLKKVREYIEVLKENNNRLETLKVKIGIDKEFLSNLYRKICSVVRAIPGKLSKEELFAFLRDGWRFSQSLIFQLDGLLPNTIVREEEFITNLMPVNMIPSEQYLTQPNTQSISTIKQKGRVEENIFLKESNQYQSYKRNELKYYPIQKNSQNQQKNVKNIYGYLYQNEKLLKKENFKQNNVKQSQIQNYQVNSKNVDEDYKNNLSRIQRSRQKLLQGSQQRKRLIDEVLNRKKFNNINYESFEKNPTIYSEINQHYSSHPKINSYLQNSSSSYLQTLKNNYFQETSPNFYQKKSYNQTLNQLVNERQPFYRQDAKYFKGSYLDQGSMTPNSLSSQINKYSSKFSRPSSGLQKQNILKRAEEQASRKIQEIERKARMKVLEKQSLIGNRFIK